MKEPKIGRTRPVPAKEKKRRDITSWDDLTGFLNHDFLKGMLGTISGYNPYCDPAI